jgi:cell division protease FtsH
LTGGGATVRATPLVAQRGFLANLLISFAPILLLVAFYVWMFAASRARSAASWAGGNRSASIQRRSASILTMSPESTKWKQKSMRSWTS